jgi:hypothetical protein
MKHFANRMKALNQLDSVIRKNLETLGYGR